MKIGVYVRTKYGITQFKEYETTNGEKLLCMPVKDGSQGIFANIEDVVKSRTNIIDLVEVGDILLIKDFVDEACMIFTDIYLIQSEQQLLNIKNDLEKNKNKKLYSIITKEQFSSMEYKIGE